MMRVILFLFFSSSLFGWQNAKKLEYTDPFGRTPTTYADWKLSQIEEPNQIGTTYLSEAKTRASLIDILLYAPLYTETIDSLNVYISDLESEGYTVQLDTIRGTDPLFVRNHLDSLLVNDLVGAVLIGEIPFAWYEMTSAEGREEFPIDLYLMDLDGNWIDNDSDGLFDDHTGNKEPEIWTGRIYAHSMTWGNEAYLVNNYLSKAHKYRTGGFNIPQKALAYVDDDWYGFGNCDLDLLYDTVDVVRDYNTTTASDFRMRLNDAYEWVQICSHSSPWGNTFKNTSGYAGTVFNFEYWFANPEFLFLNLFQCSGTRFFEENYAGGSYIFGPTNSLIAIGSDKVGSMLHFDDFYGPLAGGISIGEAFKDWFVQWGITDPDWFYGMVICGDPTLKTKQGTKKFNIARKNGQNLNAPCSWSNPEPVDTDPETDGYLDVAKDGQGRIWAAWVTGRSQSNGRTEVCVSNYDNGSWNSPEIIDPYLYWDFFPALCADATGRMWISWARVYGRNYDIFASYYDGSWSVPDRISSKATDAMAPAMTLDGSGKLWITLERWNHLNGDIYCRYNDGASWQPIFAVTVDSSNDYKPRMATDSSGVAWTTWCSERWQNNRNIYVKNYNESSSHWENIRRITSNPAQDQDPVIAVDGTGGVWVAWTSWRNVNPDIYESHYDGASWTNSHSVTTDSSSDEHVEFAVDQDGYLWCIWQSDRTGDWEIYAKYYKDGNWGNAMNISQNVGRDIFPKTTLDDSSNIWVLWQSDRDGNWNIYASHILSDLIPPAITVTQPNGGEVWNIGEIDTIRWIATDNINVDSLSILYSTNGGGDWNTVSTGEINDSTYEWTIPQTPSTNCLVRIIAYDDFPNSNEDASDNTFTIHDAIPPTAEIHYPNGGEVFSIGTLDTVRWFASDNIGVDSVRLEYSTNGGSDWVYVASPPASDTMYEWTVPPTPSTQCLMKVKAFDASLNTAEDESDSLFEIRDDSLPQITVLAPNGGEVWVYNEEHDILWDSDDNVGIDSLNITLSLDGGATYPMVVAHINGNDSSFSWTIPETTSTECLIKVEGYDEALNIASDVSDSLFTIALTGVYGSQTSLPKVTMLNSISPNPFSRRTRINFQISRKTDVQIQLYDIRGCLIENIVKKSYLPGYYSEDLNKHLSSGVYFIRFSAGKKHWLKKVIDIK